MGAQNTIMVNADNAKREEATAAAIITPGNLLERTSSDTVQKHSTAGSTNIKMFAVENDLVGNDINDNYAASEQVQYIHAVPGNLINGILADGETVVGGYGIPAEYRRHGERGVRPL
jgi:hypothetical protein